MYCSWQLYCVVLHCCAIPGSCAALFYAVPYSCVVPCCVVLLCSRQVGFFTKLHRLHVLEGGNCPLCSPVAKIRNDNQRGISNCMVDPHVSNSIPVAATAVVLIWVQDILV